MEENQYFSLTPLGDFAAHNSVIYASFYPAPSSLLVLFLYLTFLAVTILVSFLWLDHHQQQLILFDMVRVESMVIVVAAVLVAALMSI